MGARTTTKTAARVVVRLAALLVLGVTSASAQPAGAPGPWMPPPEPDVRPQLPSRDELDADNNRLDDRIDRGLGSLRRRLARETNPARREELITRLAAPRRLELVFSGQVTQQQIDDFAALGGRIDHVYRAVSYGWSGTLPGTAIDALPAAMGASLLVVAQDRGAELHMDEATRTGRIRGVWAPGFAGSQAGFSGTSDITIAIVDSGVDDSHPDLAGRLEYWKDFSGDNDANPRDVIQHGSHVAGIALGSGAAFGAESGTLRYTDSGNMAGVPANSFYLSGVHVPAQAMTFQMNSTWVGGGSTLLRLAARTNGVGGGFISICSTAAAAGSPLSLTCNTNGNVTQMYSSALPQTSGGSIGRYATTMAVSPYPAVGDGFNAFRGVAPGARWAGAKVFSNAGSGSSATIGAAIDDLVAQRSAHDIKVANLSLGLIGNPGTDAALRAKANTMVNNGIVVVASAGNDGPGTAATNTVDDPGRAALVLTVGAANDANALTRYTSSGFASPGSDEDVKPDLLAPGGSDYYSQILSVDSNDSDAEVSTFADRVANDYLNMKGTSMAAPFAAGAAALVIDAMQKAGTTWSFSSSSQPLFVKMLLNASATETNANREVSSGTNPTLGRAAAPKDLYEGYGMMNPDAAVEAVAQVYSGGAARGTTAGGAFDRRAWGWRLGLTNGSAVTITLDVPVTADYDLYLYSGTPDAKGNPVVRTSSTNAGLGADESITFTPTTSETRYLFVKRVSGSGDWSMSSGVATSSCGDGKKDAGEQCDDGNQASGDCCASDCKTEANGSPCDDGLFCTANDTCSSGACSGTGNPCSGGAECNTTCSEANDNCLSPFGLACTSDGNACTVDQCNGLGACTHPVGNAGVVCRAAAGSCDVVETCTGLTSSCPADVVLVAATPCRASAGTCDVPESCSGTSGACPADAFVGTTTVCRASSGTCDVAERCSGSAATCPANAFAPNGSSCDDGAFCNGADTCSGGSCVHAGNPCSGADGDADCSETCDESANACSANDPNGSSCNDGVACTTGETCQAGICEPKSSTCGSCGDGSVGEGEQCDDGNTASGDCCSATCTKETNGSPCNDGLFCNGDDTCSNGSCQQHEGDPCQGADGDADCTESCDETADACSGADPNESACDDGQFCNGEDTCQGGACSGHAGDPCDGADGDDDCSESCKEANDTCTTADPDASPCDDGLFCNGADTCKSGSCSQHAGSPCQGPDGDADCAESCSEGSDTCAASDPNGSACDDGVPCTVSDSCTSGICGGQPSVAPECAATTTTTTTLPPAVCGDANEDGNITAGDAQISLKTAVGSADCLKEVCDYSGDDRVTTTDALLILRAAVGQDIPPKCPAAGSSLSAAPSTVPGTTSTTIPGEEF